MLVGRGAGFGDPCFLVGKLVGAFLRFLAGKLVGAFLRFLAGKLVGDVPSFSGWRADRLRALLPFLAEYLAPFLPAPNFYGNDAHCCWLLASESCPPPAHADDKFVPPNSPAKKSQNDNSCLCLHLSHPVSYPFLLPVSALLRPKRASSPFL